MDGKRPLLLLSACLAGCRCRYDGKDNKVDKIAAWHQAGLALAVCPEVLGGLSTPRTPCEICGKRVLDKTGADKTDAFFNGALRALGMAEEVACRIAVLKARSPSCGIGAVYDGTFSHTLIPGDGLFAGMLKQKGFAVCTEENYLSLLPGLLPPEALHLLAH